VSITESKLVALPVEVLPLDKGISSSGIPDRILDLGKQFDADIGVASFLLPKVMAWTPLLLTASVVPK